MRFYSLLNLMGFSGKAHGGPPVSGCVTITGMQDSPAPSQEPCKANFTRCILFSGGVRRQGRKVLGEASSAHPEHVAVQTETCSGSPVGVRRDITGRRAKNIRAAEMNSREDALTMSSV